ncbi:hypothetical protein DFH09DRAFT_1157280, partial [Mycena vulgaris]
MALPAVDSSSFPKQIADLAQAMQARSDTLEAELTAARRDITKLTDNNANLMNENIRIAKDMADVKTRYRATEIALESEKKARMAAEDLLHRMQADIEEHRRAAVEAMRRDLEEKFKTVVQGVKNDPDEDVLSGRPQSSLQDSTGAEPTPKRPRLDEPQIYRYKPFAVNPSPLLSDLARNSPPRAAAASTHFQPPPAQLPRPVSPNQSLVVMPRTAGSLSAPYPLRSKARPAAPGPSVRR